MGFFKNVLSSDGKKSLKKLDKLAKIIEEQEPKYQAMTDEELRNQTNVFKQQIQDGKTTDDILVEAFAALREAAFRVLKMKYYHVQLIGGICLHQGRIAEMRTGEGKTLVATLPAYLNALTGEGVHIVTVNEYLAKRDAEWMGKLYKFMGLTVGVVVPGMTDEQKREAYKCDITYGTNNELGFDYLRDNLEKSLPAMRQRGLAFAIVDEVDSILIDEARTPLIISGRGDKSSRLYEDVDRFVRTIRGGYEDEKKEMEEALQERIKEAKKNGETLSDADMELECDKWDYVIDRKEKTVQITENGAIKAERAFGIENLGDITNADLNHHIQQALKAHKLFAKDVDYIVNNDEVVIVDEFTGRLMIGRRYSDGLHQAIEAKEGVKVKNENKTIATITFQNYFRLYKKLSGMTGTAKTEEAEFRTIYSLDVLEIPTNKPVIRADYADRLYATEEGKKKAVVQEIMERHEKGQPVLVGTTSVEQSESIAKLLKHNGIRHNILNAKNHEREAEIVAQAGRLGAVTIATNMAGRGTDILLGGNPEYLAKKRLREENYEHDVIEQATSYTELSPELEEVRQHYREIYELYKQETDAEKVKVQEAGGLCIIGTERHESRRIDNQLRGRAGRQGDPGMSVFFLSLEDDLIKRFGGEKMQRVYQFFKMQDDDCIESKMLSRGVENAQKAIEGRNFGIRKNVIQYDDVMNKQREIIYAERMKVLKGEDVHEQLLKYIPGFVKFVLDETVNVEELPEKWDVDALNKALELRILPEGTQFTTAKELAKMDYNEVFNRIVEQATEGYNTRIANIEAELREKIGDPNISFAVIERQILLSTVDTNWIDHIDAMDQLRKGISLRAYAQVDPVIAYKQEGFEMFDEMIERIQNRTISLLLKVRITEAKNAPANKPAPAQTEEKLDEAQGEKKAEGESAPAAQNTEAPAPAEQKSATASEYERAMLLPTTATARSGGYTTNSSEGNRPVIATKKPGPNSPCPCGSGKKYKKCCGNPANKA